MKTNQCKACEHSGLPILFVYHAAVALDSEFSPVKSGSAEGLQMPLTTAATSPGEKPVLQTHLPSVDAFGLVSLMHSRYVLRTLRPGTFLYIHHEKPSKVLQREAKPRLKRDPKAAHWEVFRVLAGGCLAPFGDSRFFFPVPFSCTEDGGKHVMTTVTYRLRDAHEEGGIRVAVSGNYWPPRMREKNKGAMQRIDIPAILGGSLPPPAIRPAEGTWLDTHVADFAIEQLDHGGFPFTSPLAKLKSLGTAQLQRMLALSSGHEKTTGKGFVMPLRDPVGTTQALGDIARCRASEAKAYEYSQRHPVGAAAGIAFLFDRVSSEQLARSKANPLKRRHLYDSQNQPLYVPEGKDLIPPEDEWEHWAFMGMMARTDFRMAVEHNADKTVPLNSRFITSRYRQGALEGRAGSGVEMGYVLAPIEGRAVMYTRYATQKMDRMQVTGAVNEFFSRHNARRDRFATLIDNHNADHAKWMGHGLLESYFLCHFDSEDNKTDLFVHGEAYMEEAQRCVAGSDGLSPALEDTVWKLLTSKSIEGPDGWLLRAMVGNSKELIEPLQTFWTNQLNWYTEGDKKQDKSFDTIKALVCDDDAGQILAKAHLGWLRPAGVGMSFGLMHFIVGAGSYFAAKALEKMAPAQVAQGKAAAQGAGQRLTGGASRGLQAMQTDLQARAQRASDLLNSTQMRFACKVDTWCLTLGSVLHGVLNRTPPDRPIKVSIDLTGRQFLGVMAQIEALKAERISPGIRSVNRRTQAMADHLKTAPALELDASYRLEFNTTANRLKDSPNIAALTRNATEVSKGRGTPSPEVLQRTEEELAEFYNKQHRFDDLKNSVMRLINLEMPKAANAASAAVASGATSVLDTLAGPGGVLEAGVKGGQRVGAAALGTTFDTGAQFSVLGGLLQWRLFQINSAKLDILQARLAWDNLTPAQRDALNEAIQGARWGVIDNAAGMSGGALEAASVLADKLRGVAVPAFLAAGAYFSGAVGGFANAMQNYDKAMGKKAEGDNEFFGLYASVGFLYGLSSLALVGAGIEVGHAWLKHRIYLKASLRGASFATQQTALRLGGEVVARRVFGLSLAGWGTLLTLLAFVSEGIVVYLDRTPLEAWIEGSFFGEKPKFRGKSGRDNWPENWPGELTALIEALEKSTAALIANTDIEIVGPPPMDITDARNPNNPFLNLDNPNASPLSTGVGF